ncbi:MAG: substrate-binding domain-containing protein [Roseobacter sp.]
MIENARLQILSAGAPKVGVLRCAQACFGPAGIQFQLDFATAPEISERVANGTTHADVVVAPTAVMRTIVTEGAVVGGSLVALGRVSTGVAVANETYKPDISSSEALRGAIADADGLVFNRASSGKHVEALIESFGFAERLADKIVRTDSGSQVMEYLAENRLKKILAFAQVTEIRFREDLGVRLVGPLPHSLGRHTQYVSALAGDAANIAPAKALLAFFESSEGREILSNAGLDL